jgi:hypothetical protein
MAAACVPHVMKLTVSLPCPPHQCARATDLFQLVWCTQVDTPVMTLSFAQPGVVAAVQQPLSCVNMTRCSAIVWGLVGVVAAQGPLAVAWAIVTNAWGSQLLPCHTAEV